MRYLWSDHTGKSAVYFYLAKRPNPIRYAVGKSYTYISPCSGCHKTFLEEIKISPKLNFAENNLLSDLICKFIVQITIILAKLEF